MLECFIRQHLGIVDQHCEIESASDAKRHHTVEHIACAFAGEQQCDVAESRTARSTSQLIDQVVGTGRGPQQHS